MTAPESPGASGEEVPDGEQALLDINGNPIPRNWNPQAPPAPPDAEPPGAAKSPGGGKKPAARPPASAPPRAYQPPPRQAVGGGFTSGLGTMPGEDDVRLDLTGKPLPPMKASAAPAQPTYSSASSGRPGGGPQRAKSGGSNPLGAVFALILVILIAGAGYVMYTKYQTNQQNQAKPAASDSGSDAGTSSGAGTPAGHKLHTAHASPFGSKP